MRFPPRTPADYALLDIWINCGLPQEEILQRTSYEVWRSELVEFNGDYYCKRCSQHIARTHCNECGQPTNES